MHKGKNVELSNLSVISSLNAGDEFRRTINPMEIPSIYGRVIPNVHKFNVVPIAGSALAYLQNLIDCCLSQDLYHLQEISCKFIYNV